MPGNTDPCEGLMYSRIPDKFSTDCKKYLKCEEIYRGGRYITAATVKECPSGTIFRPFSGCVTNQQCSNYQCSAQGIFENPDDCSTFIRCWEYQINNFQFFHPDLYQCPSNTKFNPISKKCDSFYKCDGVDPHGGIDPCSDTTQKFLINSIHNSMYLGYYHIVANPYDNQFSSYLRCAYNFEGYGWMDVILKQECPAISFFSPYLGKCYKNFDPNESCSKDPCGMGPGRYVDFKSGHCSSFVECHDHSNNLEVYKASYEIHHCPPGTFYSPETDDCDPQYDCPRFQPNYCYPLFTTTPAPTTTSAPAPTTSGPDW